MHGVGRLACNPIDGCVLAAEGGGRFTGGLCRKIKSSLKYRGAAFAGAPKRRPGGGIFGGGAAPSPGGDFVGGCCHGAGQSGGCILAGGAFTGGGGGFTGGAGFESMKPAGGALVAGWKPALGGESSAAGGDFVGTARGEVSAGGRSVETGLVGGCFTSGHASSSSRPEGRLSSCGGAFMGKAGGGAFTRRCSTSSWTGGGDGAFIGTKARGLEDPLGTVASAVASGGALTGVSPIAGGALDGGDASKVSRGGGGQAAVGHGGTGATAGGGGTALTGGASGGGGHIVGNAAADGGSVQIDVYAAVVGDSSSLLLGSDFTGSDFSAADDNVGDNGCTI